MHVINDAKKKISVFSNNNLEKNKANTKCGVSPRLQI